MGRSRTQSTAVLPIPDRFDQLEELPPSELEKLATDELALSEFFQKLDFCKTSQKRRDTLQKQNEELAGRNLKKLEEIEAKHRELEAGRQTYTEMHSVVSEELQRHDAKLQRRTPHAITAMLLEGAKEMESASESSASSVKSGQLDIHQFISQHVDERKQYHQALIIKERLQNAPATGGGAYGARQAAHRGRAY